MSAFTPGPWRVGKATEFGTFACGLIYAQDEHEAVAQVMGLPTNGRVEDLPAHYAQPLANAYVLAAAPELLEALSSVMRELPAALKRGYADANTLAAFNAAEAAIAKATGDDRA